MKKILVLYLVIIIIAMFLGCAKNINKQSTENNTSISKVNLLKFTSYSEIDSNQLLKVIEKKNDLNIIKLAIDSSKKVELNSSDLIDGAYSMNIISKDGKVHGYYIVIIKEKSYILMIDANNTNIGYESQNKNFKQLVDILSN